MFRFIVVIVGTPDWMAHAGFVTRADAEKWANANSCIGLVYEVKDTKGE